MKSDRRFCYFQTALFLMLAGMAAQAFGQGREPVLPLAKKEKPAPLETLKELVSIESGSRDYEGLHLLGDTGSSSCKPRKYRRLPWICDEL